MKKSILVLVLSLFAFSTFAENFDESKKNEMQFKVGYFPYVESVVLALIKKKEKTTCFHLLLLNTCVM